ncbi:MAG: hypothetical protein AAGA85_00540 [Bacteroidota bacterium]
MTFTPTMAVDKGRISTECHNGCTILVCDYSNLEGDEIFAFMRMIEVHVQSAAPKSLCVLDIVHNVKVNTRSYKQLFHLAQAIQPYVLRWAAMGAAAFALCKEVSTEDFQLVHFWSREEAIRYLTEPD